MINKIQNFLKIKLRTKKKIKVKFLQKIIIYKIQTWKNKA